MKPKNPASKQCQSLFSLLRQRMKEGLISRKTDEEIRTHPDYSIVAVAKFFDDPANGFCLPIKSPDQKSGLMQLWFLFPSEVQIKSLEKAFLTPLSKRSFWDEFLVLEAWLNRLCQLKDGKVSFIGRILACNFSIYEPFRGSNSEKKHLEIGRHIGFRFLKAIHTEEHAVRVFIDEIEKDTQEEG